MGKNSVEIHFAEINRFNISAISIAKWFDSVCKQEGCKLAQISIILCSDDYLLSMNQEHLDHDYYTDIITFDLSDAPEEIEGELYISTDRVKENADDLSLPFEIELHRVLIHGILHLIGYSDKSSADQKIMRGKEDAYLSLLPHL